MFLEGQTGNHPEARSLLFPLQGPVSFLKFHSLNVPRIFTLKTMGDKSILVFETDKPIEKLECPGFLKLGKDLAGKINFFPGSS